MSRLDTSRTGNSIRNVGTSVAGQVINNVMRFLCRTAFIYTLGKEFLGISSLYVNILTLLSISELGFASAITYSLYKPLAENDESAIASLMAFFRKAYRFVGLAILVIGLILLPFLPHLMTGVTDRVNIYLYYILYLIQTVVSYLFFAYKSTLLIADQQKYLYDLISYAVQIAMNLVQILILVVWHSFFGYTVAAIGSTILLNILVACAVDRRYPYINKPAPKLKDTERKNVFSRVYAMSLYKACSAVGVATDNLIISAFIGTVMVGLYNNYYMIIAIVQTLLGEMFRAFSASLGNLYATEDKKKNAFVFRSLNLANAALVTLFSVAFLVLFQPFVTIWAGEDYLLSVPVLIIIVLNFATNYLQNMVQIYREVSGVFVRGKYRAVAQALLNLVISIILVQKLGLAGVFLGSIISRLATLGWYDPWLVHRKGFGVSPAPFYVQCGISIGLGGGLSALIVLCSRFLPAGSWSLLLFRALLCVAFTAGVYFILYRRTKEFRYLKEKAMQRLKKRKSRR